MPKTTTNIQGQPTNSDRSRKRIYKDRVIDMTNKKWLKDDSAHGNLHRLVPIKKYYRIAHKDTNQGLWYSSKGAFTGLIHNEFNFCMNSKLPMPFDQDLVGWLSATDTLKDLFNWFSIEDIERLEKHGWFITVYEAYKAKQYKNHLVICQSTSTVLERIPIESVLTHPL